MSDSAKAFEALVRRIIPAATVGRDMIGFVTFDATGPKCYVKGSYDPRHFTLSYAGQTDDGRQGIFAKAVSLADIDGDFVEADASEALSFVARWLS